MKSIDRAVRRTNRNTHGTKRRFKTVILVSALLMLGTAMAVPFTSVDLSSRRNTATAVRRRGESTADQDHPQQPRRRGR